MAITTVHPHVRGDDLHALHLRIVRIGSPPRAWGRRALLARLFSVGRFTPTCVGTTTRRRAEPRGTAVHPHVRGDDSFSFAWFFSTFGSPPRAWGRRCRLFGALALTRFTPTCVGTTRTCNASLTRRAVHPHVRGDDRQSAPATVARRGSPPRAWGRRGWGMPVLLANRFTPTCVGTTKHHHFSRKARRFTPTCVGTTMLSAWCSSSAPVHPHVRGDDSMLHPAVQGVCGSPPRAWGRQVHQAWSC